MLQLPHISSNSLEETQVTGPSIGHCHWVQTWLRSLSFLFNKNPWEMDVFFLDVFGLVPLLQIKNKGFIKGNAWIAGSWWLPFSWVFIIISTSPNGSQIMWLAGLQQNLLWNGLYPIYTYNQLPLITDPNEFQTSASHKYWIPSYDSTAYLSIFTMCF